MYQDSNRIRRHRISISLDQYEIDLIQALVNYTGQERAVLLRQMILAEAQQCLIDKPIVAVPPRNSEALIYAC